MEKLADSLDIAESYYEQALAHNQVVSQWLAKEVSALQCIVLKYIHRWSFSLVTVVKLLNDQDKYDIDLVCQLEFSKQDLSNNNKC